MPVTEAARDRGGWHIVPVGPGAPAETRRFVVACLQMHGAEGDVVRDLALAASELAANVVQHGGGTEIRVQVDESDPDWWVLTVAGGVATLPKHLHRVDDWAIAPAGGTRGGRGLGIVREVVDDVQLSATTAGVTITCRQRRRRPGATPQPGTNRPV